ncbi:hypothetical protein [Streptomyces sp. NPDC018045]|uniref:hypothetical protein n=1 Tax=Streptomyces sp. NPDC018045 TaxID=3365037 RepID=UPI00379C437A
MRSFSRLLALGAVTVTTTLAGSTAAIADDTPPTGVEDFEYPQAAKIAEERGIKLKRGDGHVTLVPCDSRPGLIEITARGMTERDKVGKGRFCFRVTGKSGYLSLELPSVYLAKGNDYNVDLNMQTDNTDKTFKLEKNNWTPVGETADTDRRQFTLLEIIAKK